MTIGALLLGGCVRKPRTPVYQPKTDRSHYQPVVPSDTVSDEASKQPGTESVVSAKPDTLQPSVLSDENDQSRERLQISLEFVSSRFLAYSKKLEKWKEYDNQSSVLNFDQQATEQMVGCFRDLQKMINGYGRLRDMLEPGENASLIRTMTPDQVQALQENDVLFLESFCGKLLDTEKSVTAFGESGSGKDSAQIEMLISQSFQNGEYEQVVQLWLQIPEDKVGEITISTKRMYGKSLMFLHQEQKAAAVYEQILVDLGRKEKETTDVLELYKILSNLYMAGRNYSAAADQYRKIQEKYRQVLQVKEWSELQQSILRNSKMRGRELNEYSAILRNYMGYIPSQDGYKPVRQAEQFLENYPESPTITNVDVIKSEIYFKAESWFKKVIADVEGLQLQEQYQDGLLLLETIPQDIVGPEHVQLIQKKIDELRGVEEIVLENLRIEKMQALETGWNQTLALVESGKYDEAIAQLNTMHDTDYSDKASAKIAEVSLLAAKKNRQQAARLFVRAAKTTELESKKQLLLESHQLLMQIVLKYPGTRIIDKVMSNMQRVELEMNKLDPTLVEWSKMTAKQKMMLDNPQTEETMNMEERPGPMSPSQLNIHGPGTGGSQPTLYQDSLNR